MELLFEVFEKLSIDQTIFIQFILVLIFFFILKTLLFSKLQFVLELRDSKTTKMEENANRKFVQADQLAERYKEETEQAYTEAQEIFSRRKADLVNEERARFKQVEFEVQSEAEKQRQAFAQEVSGHKKKVMEGADQLADDLVQKIVH